MNENLLPSTRPAGLKTLLARMVANQAYIAAAGARDVIVVNTAYPRLLQKMTLPQLVTQTRINVQGEATKKIVIGTCSLDLTLDLTAIRCFGVRVRIAESIFDWRNGAVEFELRDNATPVAKWWAVPNSVPCDMIVLGISVASGQAVPKAIAQPVLFVEATDNGVLTTTQIVLESLNARDLDGLLPQGDEGVRDTVRDN